MTDDPARPPVPYETVRSSTTHHGVLSDVRVDEVAMPDGTLARREVVERPQAVGVVPVDADGQVVLVRQHRHPVGRSMLEIPAGLVEPGEDAEATAARELAEETGLAARRLERLAVIANSAGWTDETTVVLLGRDLEAVGAPEGFEPSGEEAAMELVRMPLALAASAVADGSPADAKTLAGLLLAAERLHRPGG